MAKGLFIIIVIVLILLGMSIMREGKEAFQESPVQSTIESGKTIIDTGKDVVNKFKGEEVNTGLIEVGKIPCAIDADCNILSECSYYLCSCFGGSCFLNEE